jgi:uncharacterized membrane protein YdjX (TVP38/TMEM64 family)
VSRKVWSKKRLILGAIILIFIAMIWSTGLHKKLTFDQVKTNTVWMRDQIEHHYWWSVMVYLSIIVTIIVCSLPALALMNIIGGFLFGVMQGVFLIVIGATIGGTLFFFIVRYIIGSYLQARFNAQLLNFNRMWNERGWFFLLTLRFIPFIPFFMVTLLAGLTNIRTRTFIWTTALGVIPMALILTYAGRQLGTIRQLQDIFTAPILIALILLLLLAILPILMTRNRKLF